MAEVWADISRASPIEDAAADLAELITVCLVGLALHLMGRAEREEISSLRKAANVDHLTGLGSRSFFHRAAERRIALYRRNGLTLSCAVFDVDAFKSYNDLYGHGSGDEVLRHKIELESETANESPLGSSVTVSVGIAALTKDVSSLEQLVETADGELYRAKRAGKNRVAAAGRR